MSENEKITPFPKRKRETLEDFAVRKDIDEMGLLDLIFIEEILNQEKQDKAG